MELALLVYGVSLLDGLLNFLGLVAVAAITGVLVSGIAHIEIHGDTSGPKMWLKRCVVTLFAVGFISALIPNQRTAYIMVAAYATQKIAQTPEARVTGDKVLTLINSKLDQLIQEADEPKKKGR